MRRATRLCAVIVAATCAATPSARASVLIVTSDFDDNPAYVTDVKNKLAATKQIIGNIDIFNAAVPPSGVTRASVPTAATLLTYDGVLVFGEAGFANAKLLGDRLADYAADGRTVVEAAFCGGKGGTSTLGGKWQDEAYAPFVNLPNHAAPGFGSGSLTLGTRHLPASPLLGGVVSFGGGSGSYHNLVAVAPTGVVRVADWSNGDPLVVRRQNKPGAVVGLNFYPPSSAVRGDFWNGGTNGGLLMANALNAQPAPEPGTAALVLLSMLPLAGRPRWIRRRRARKL